MVAVGQSREWLLLPLVVLQDVCLLFTFASRLTMRLAWRGGFPTGPSAFQERNPRPGVRWLAASHGHPVPRRWERIWDICAACWSLGC